MVREIKSSNRLFWVIETMQKLYNMDKHNLIDEFPEYKEKIHDLKVSDAHFHKLFVDYDNATTDIHRIETGAENTSDEVLNELRMKRVHLKDELYQILQSN